MHSLISIVGVVLTGKENHPKWYRKIKHTLIFNNLWNGICEVGIASEKEEQSKAQPKNSRTTIPTSNKEHAIWKNKD
jgi:hypothetical protein